MARWRVALAQHGSSRLRLLLSGANENAFVEQSEQSSRVLVVVDELSVMAFKSVRRALCRFLFVAIGATLGLFAALRSGVQVLIKGKAILKPKERKEEPACLRDPALGTHEFVTLEVGHSL